MEACVNFLYPSGTIHFYQSDEQDAKVLVTVLIRDFINGNYGVNIYNVYTTTTSKRGFLYFKYIDPNLSLRYEDSNNIFNFPLIVKIDQGNNCGNFSYKCISNEFIKEHLEESSKEKHLVINTGNVKQIIRYMPENCW